MLPRKPVAHKYGQRLMNFGRLKRPIIGLLGFPGTYCWGPATVLKPGLEASDLVEPSADIVGAPN